MQVTNAPLQLDQTGTVMKLIEKKL